MPYHRRTDEQRWRLLTEGEIAIAALLFGDAIDYSRVRIHRRRYIPFQPRIHRRRYIPFQPENCAMTPNGNMCFHHSCLASDTVHRAIQSSGIGHKPSSNIHARSPTKRAKL
jgi:hypothetical protein